MLTRADINKYAASYSFRGLSTEKLREIVNSPVAIGTMAWDLAAQILMERNEKFEVQS
jgi:hypothetical protein